MAFYSPNFSEPYLHHFHHISYKGNYENSLHQASPPYSDYGFQFDPFDPIPYNHHHQQHHHHHDDRRYLAYDSSPTVRHSYSVNTYSHPNLIEFGPSSYSAIYSPAQTQFMISYSVSDFNEPEFVEYDPTPYGGGYDITKTYGKPLPPSEEICYPPSTKEPSAQSLDLLPRGSTEPPHEKEEIDGSAEKPQNGNGSILIAEEEHKEDSLAEHGETREEIHDKDDDSDSGSESDRTDGINEGYAVEDVRQSDSGSKSDDANGVAEGYAVGGLREVPIVPSGYGLEAIDICESLFGYWPCLARYRRENSCEGVGDRGGRCVQNQWQNTADYLFGGLNPYEAGDLKDGFGSPLW